MLLWTVGPLCAGIGVILIIVGAIARIAPMMLVGLAYAGGGGLFLAIAGTLKHSSSHSSRQSSSPSGDDSRRGAVFVLVLLLVGVVAALTLHTQMRAVAAVRSATLRQQRTILRLAAADSAWSFVKDTLKTAGTNDLATSWSTPQRLTLPSGYDTEVAVENASVTLGPEIPALAEQKLRTPLYRVVATASASGAVETVSCFVGRPSGGTIEIMGWHEER
jgi:hypothetical protein